MTALPLRSLPIVLLAATGFAIGSTEFLAVGIVPEIAHDLHASTSAAGLAVSLYAVSVAVTTLPMTVAFGHRRPRALVAAMVVLSALAHAVMALSPSLPVLLAGRILAATTHGLALGVSMAAASALVRDEDKAKAISAVFGGLLTAMFLGAPLGTWLSDLVGWRLVFAFLGVVSVALAAGIYRFVPELPGAPSSGWASLRPLCDRAVAVPLVSAAAILAGGSVLFAYLGAFLNEVTGLSGSGVALGLAAFGGAGVIGNLIGGRLADQDRARPQLVAIWVVPMAVLAVGLGGSLAPVVLTAIVVWGVAQTSLLPGLTHRAIQAGGTVAGPAQNAAANVGIAVGGLVGGGVVAAAGVSVSPYVAVGLMVVTGGLFSAQLLRASQAPARQSTPPGSASAGGVSAKSSQPIRIASGGTR